MTADTTREGDINTRKHHIQEIQEVSPFSTGDHKTAMNRHDSMADNKKGSTKEALNWNIQTLES